MKATGAGRKDSQEVGHIVLLAAPTSLPMNRDLRLAIRIPAGGFTHKGLNPIPITCVGGYDDAGVACGVGRAPT